MGSKSAPAPDYRGAAEEQSAASKEIAREQTLANRPDQYTPWGSSEWSQLPDGRWEQNINLSPEEQQALNAQRDVQTGRSELAAGLIGRTGQELEDPFAWGSLPEAGTTPGSGQFQSEIADAAYNPDFAQTQFDRQMSLQGPLMERQVEALEVQLRNQGLRPGTEAYDNAMNDLRNQQGEMTSRMSQDAMMLGANEQQRQFGRNQAAGQFYNQAGQQEFGQSMQQSSYQNQLRQQAMAEEAQRRGISINEMNALLTGQQVQNPSMPSFNPASAGQAPNYMGAASAQGQHDLANAQLSWRPWEMATNLAGSAMGSWNWGS